MTLFYKNVILVLKIKNKNVERSFFMKSIGIVRKVDELGRIVLPKELRNTFKIDHKDPIEIFVEGDSIILKKYEPACLFCGNASDVVTYMDKKVCKECISKLKEA